MAQVKAIIYLPLRNNDDRELKAEISQVEWDLWNHFGAWTNVGYRKGAWRLADGRQSLDDLQVYAIVLDDARLPELEQILKDFKGKTDQEAIYLEINRNVEVHLI
jgi:hypothetical protein